MSALIRFAPASLTADQYDESVRWLTDAGDFPPDGLDYHVCFGSSREQLEAFGQRLMPVLAELGLIQASPSGSRSTTSSNARRETPIGSPTRASQSASRGAAGSVTFARAQHPDLLVRRAEGLVGGATPAGVALGAYPLDTGATLNYGFIRNGSTPASGGGLVPVTVLESNTARGDGTMVYSAVGHEEISVVFHAYSDQSNYCEVFGSATRAQG